LVQGGRGGVHRKKAMVAYRMCAGLETIGRVYPT